MRIEPKNISLKDGRTITLKSPKPEEAAQLLSHLQIVFRESYRNMNHPAKYFDNFPVEKEAEILQTFVESKNQFMISAFYQDQIVGNLGCFGNAGEFLKHSARAIGLHRLELTVRAFNQSGIKLYETCGFELVGRLKDMAFIDGEFHDELYYQLIL